MTQEALRHYTATAERASAQVIGSYSTSFGLATRLLGPRHRRHIRNIYALVRIADELVDGVTAEAALPAPDQAAALDRLEEETHRALATGFSSNLVVHAFAATAREAGIGAALVDPFFDSMRADLRSGHVAFDASSHESYVHGSAEVVGLMCLKVFTRGQEISPARSARLEAGAVALGAAFQNVNFLRDLADDTGRLGRSYLTGQARRLSQPDVDAWVTTVRGQLRTAAASVPLLPRDARAAVRAAADLFGALTDRIEKVGVDGLYHGRVRVSDPLKAALGMRALASSWLESHR